MVFLVKLPNAPSNNWLERTVAFVTPLARRQVSCRSAPVGADATAAQPNYYAGSHVR